MYSEEQECRVCIICRNLFYRIKQIKDLNVFCYLEQHKCLQIILNLF